MKNTVEFICALGFGFLPIVVLTLRAFRPRVIPWWAVFMVTLVLGWVLAVVSAIFHEGPDTGAGHMGALFFGWAIALVWLMPWLVVYASAQGLRRLLGRRTAAKPRHPGQSTSGS